MRRKHFQRFLQRPISALVAVASDPIEAWSSLLDRTAESREEHAPPDFYKAEDDWERRLHHLLGQSSPCEVTPEFWVLWPEVIKEMEAEGIRVGPKSFADCNDGDAGFVRAIWCLTRHLRARTVVETGVAHGFTSRFILEALERNGSGHLWSIDRPPLRHGKLHEEIGMAVGGRFPQRWSYVRGSSRRRLPSVLSQLGEIDLFVHDSLHSEHNVRFEMDRAWAALRPGGAIVVDDVDDNRGFRSFTNPTPVITP